MRTTLLFIPSSRGLSFALAVILVLETLAAHAAPAVSDTESPPGVYVEAGRHRLHINCQGQGRPAVILESGLGGTSLDWVRVQSQVAEFTRVCSYDRAGYGWSDPGPMPRTSRRIVRELNALLTRAAVDAPYILVGHSFGGLNARLFANQYPEKTSGLILLDATHELQFERLAEAGTKPLVPTGDRPFIIANYWSVPDRLPGPVRPLAQTLAVKPAAVKSLRSELRNIRTSAQQVKKSAALPDVPLVVVTHDAAVSAHTERAQVAARLWLELQRELATRTSQGSFLLVPKSGHHIHLDAPNTVVEAIRGVVDAARTGKPQTEDCDQGPPVEATGLEC